MHAPQGLLPSVEANHRPRANVYRIATACEGEGGAARKHDKKLVFVIKLGNAGPHLPYAGCGSGDGFEFEDARRSGWVICDRRFV